MSAPKGALFLSHVSSDADVVSRLKSQIARKAGSDLEIFASSDGQGIPFGSNWVVEVEEALKRAKLLFALVTPDALNSSWVTFEIGYAYALGVRVVPIGLFGVDVAEVLPPLSLLQGYNLNSAASMNNIIENLNKELGLGVTERFSNEEYASVFLQGGGGVIQDLTDEVWVDGTTALPDYESVIDAILDVLGDSAWKVMKTKIAVPGALLRSTNLAIDGGGHRGTFAATIDPRCLTAGLGCVERVVQAIGFESLRAGVQLEDSIPDAHVVAGMLDGSVDLCPDGALVHEGVKFRIWRSRDSEGKPSADSLSFEMSEGTIPILNIEKVLQHLHSEHVLGQK